LGGEQEKISSGTEFTHKYFNTTCQV